MRYGKIRQKYFLLALCALCLLGMILAGGFLKKTGGRYLAVPAADVSKIQEMLVGGYAPYDAKPALYFDGHAPAYDSVEDIYYITQSMEGDSFSGVLSSGEGKLYWQKDGYFDAFQDALAAGHVFSLYCIDDKEARWCRYRVVFTGMPVMVIETKSRAAIGDDMGEDRKSVV